MSPTPAPQSRLSRRVKIAVVAASVALVAYAVLGPKRATRAPEPADTAAQCKNDPICIGGHFVVAAYSPCKAALKAAADADSANTYSFDDDIGRPLLSRLIAHTPDNALVTYGGDAAKMQTGGIGPSRRRSYFCEYDTRAHSAARAGFLPG